MSIFVISLRVPVTAGWAGLARHPPAAWGRTVWAIPQLAIIARMAMFIPPVGEIPEVLNGWRQDLVRVLHQDAPKIIFVILLALVVIRVFRAIVTKMVSLQERRLASGIGSQQVRTLAAVVNSVGVFVVVFVSTLMILGTLGLNVAPLLASAGVVGLAIGFGAQTLVKDVINGFFILLENQYDVGDVVRIAGVKGTVENMSLRHTTLRDDDGTIHIVPNSAVLIVSNTTRDWSQITLKVVVAYSESSERIVALLKQLGEEIRHDPAYAEDIVSEIQVPGIDRVGNGEAEYLVLIKTRPSKQWAVSRELRRRIKECFHKNNVQTAGPGKVYVIDQAAPAS
jgi:small conductance mechanosensitive channel